MKISNKVKLGRPTGFYPDLGKEILELMAMGLSLTAACAELNIHRQRIYDWIEKHSDEFPEFSDNIKLAKGKRQLFLEKRLLSDELPSAAMTGTIFALKNAAPEDWRDKHEFDHTSSDGSMAPTRIEIVAPK